MSAIPKREATQKTGQIERVLEHARTRLAGEQREQAEPWLRAYYAEVDPAELAERSIADLYGAALSHLRFARRFSSSESRCEAATTWPAC